MPASRREEARRRKVGLEQEGSIHQTMAFGGRIWVLGFGVWSGGGCRQEEHPEEEPNHQAQE